MDKNHEEVSVRTTKVRYRPQTVPFRTTKPTIPLPLPLPLEQINWYTVASTSLRMLDLTFQSPIHQRFFGSIPCSPINFCLHSLPTTCTNGFMSSEKLSHSRQIESCPSPIRLVESSKLWICFYLSGPCGIFNADLSCLISHMIAHIPPFSPRFSFPTNTYFDYPDDAQAMLGNRCY